MKRSPLVRRTPLRARQPMRRGRSSSRYARRPRDLTYLMAVKQLPCVARDLSPCEGVIEADHGGRRGLGQKCSDTETLSICTGHHRARTDFSGPFKHFDQAQMREWLAAAVVATRAQLEAHTFHGDGCDLAASL